MLGLGLSIPEIAIRGRRGFSPASLFANGEQGAWYDLNLTEGVLYQDSAGTTPVTAVEQPVGLMLDKSKGLVLGADVVVNSSFDSDTDWTKSAGATISGGVLTLVSNGAIVPAAYQAGTFVSGVTYQITYTITRYSGAAGVRVQLLGGTNRSGVTRTSTGTFTEVLVGGDNTSLYIIGLNAFSTNADIDNISVRELAGNHAFNTNATTVRPTLSARINLLTYSERFDNAAWAKVQLTAAADTVTSPLGDMTADTLAENTAPTPHYTRQTITTVAANHIFSLYVKAGSCPYALVVLSPSSNGFSAGYAGVLVDLATGAITDKAATLAVISSSSEPVGSDGWYKISFTTTLAAGTNYAFVYTANSTADSPATSYVGLSRDLYIWGADLRVANESATIPYQRVTTATDYDADPTKFPYYLSFDGVSDWLQTASIDFTATDKMSVFAGVRKLSDAAAGTVVELSATTASNNGTFALTAPSAAAANYNFTAGGTTRVDSTGSAFTAPTTDVLTGIADISGDSNLLRVDAYQAALNLSDQGTGNFGNYAMFIGRRNGASVPFSGRLYSLIVRGALTDAATIALAEDYVETKTFGKNMNIVFITPLTAADGTTPITTADGDDLYLTSSYE